jgi:hypothetical protein
MFCLLGIVLALCLYLSACSKLTSKKSALLLRIVSKKMARGTVETNTGAYKLLAVHQIVCGDQSICKKMAYIQKKLT